MRARIIGAPREYQRLLEPLPEGVVVAEENEDPDFVQLFATRMGEVKTAAPGILKHAAPGAVVWITYPKKSSGTESDLSRDGLAEAIQKFGWRPVSIVSIDDVWSALRFRPVADVKARSQPKPVQAGKSAG